MPDLDETLLEEDAQYIEHNDDGTLTVHLENAVEYKRGKDMVELHSITFRKSNGADWMDTDKAKGELSKMGRLAASLGNVPFKVLQTMDGDDFLRVCRIAGQLGNHLKTGGKL